jgi:hypothetical protein
MSRLLLVALVLVTLGVVAAAAVASQDTTPRTLSYLAVENPKRELYVDVGTKGEGPGDVVFFSERLHRGSAASAPVGRTEIRCMFFRDGEARCEGALVLSNGTVEAAGYIRFARTFRIPIVGGTKAYAGVNGELVVTELTQTRSRYTVRLVG